MKKELGLHLMYVLAVFGLIVVVKSWFTLDLVVPFFVGGIIGTFFPYLDYLVYAYLLKPSSAGNDGSSLARGTFLEIIRKYHGDKSIAADLVFHSALFQAVFSVFTFFIVTSSASLLARGIVFSFSMHLILDQVNQYVRTKDIESWFARFPIDLEAGQRLTFVVGNAVLLFVFALFF